MKLLTPHTIQVLPHLDSSRKFWTPLIAFVFALSSSPFTFAQNDDNDEEPLVVRMYDVEDLVTKNDNHPFNGFVLPGVSAQSVIPSPTPTNTGSNISIGGGGGGFGGGGGGGGGGVFRMPPVAPNPLQGGMGGGGMGGGGMGGGMGQYGGGGFGGGHSSQRSPIDSLIDVITSTVAVDYWEDYGGEGTITNFGNILIVSQTPTVHQQIDAFLTLLRATRKTNETPITIKAIWLTIDETQLDSLKLSKNQTVDPEALKNLVKDHGRRGQITCFHGQTVHVAAGNLKSSVESVIPVVGQIEYETQLPQAIATNRTSQESTDAPERPPIPKHVMAQVQDPAGPATAVTGGGGFGVATSDSSVGYTPVMRWINYGAVVQMTPQIESDNQRIYLDLTSIFIMPNGSTPAAGMLGDSINVDRHSLRAQQFRTSVRLKDSTPTLVGGSAITSDNTGAQQTYLIVETILGDK